METSEPSNTTGQIPTTENPQGFAALGTIWWPQVCGNRTIRDAFWSDDYTVNTFKPDFTDCFQDTVLVWGVCVILWICAPFYLISLSGRKVRHRWTSFSKLNLAKLVIGLLLIVCTVVEFVHQVSAGPETPPSKWLAQIVYFITLVLAIFLMRREFRRGEHSSGVLFCFWGLLLIINIVPFRTKILVTQENGEIEDEFSFALFYVFFGLLVVQFSLHFFSDFGAIESSSKVVKDNDERTPLLMDKSYTEDVTVTREDSVKELNPVIKATFVSRMTYIWVFRFLWKGYKRAITAKDLWKLRLEDQAVPNAENFYDCWKRSSREPGSRPAEGNRALKDLTDKWSLNSSLIKSLVRCFGFDFSLLALYEIANIALTFLRPTILDALIGFVSSGDMYIWRGYLYAALMFVITLVRAIVNQRTFEGKMIIGLRIRSSLTAAIYRKTLILANSVRKDYSVGEIVNLMSVDAQRISDATFFLHNLWAAPVNIVVAMVMLWGYLGPASLAGLGVLIALMIINFFLASRIKKLQVTQMFEKDKRLKLTNEVLTGIRVLKLYAWEGAFQKKLADIRNSEVNLILRAAYYIAGTAISMTCAPVLYTVASFTIYILASNDSAFSAQVAFVSLSLVNSLTRPLSFLPNGIANIVQAVVSINRVEKVLNGDELDSESVQHRPSANAIEVKDGGFSWDEPEVNRTTLKDIQFEVKPGSLTVVVGQVGAGKSSLLSATLGEMHKLSGSVNILGSVAYVPQEAWIRNQTVESNIIFGKAMDRNRYDNILHTCSLTQDLKILPGGDQTEIGEKGINLSGGQKQRVSLARAVYLDSDIYLLDDPLSAVDAHVGKHIFDNVIGPSGCLKDKTRILVTHGLTHLPKSDQVIVMKDGTISEQGTYSELLQHNGAFADLIRTYLNDEDDDEDDPEAHDLRQELRRQVSQLSDTGGEGGKSGGLSSASESEGSERLRRRKGSSGRRQSKHGDPKTDAAVEKKLQGAGSKRGQKLIDTEMAQTGGVNFKVFMIYLKAMGTIPPILVLCTAVLQMASDLGSNIWLSEWSRDTDIYVGNNTMPPGLPSLRVGVYGGLGGMSALMTFGQTMALAVAATTAARILHEVLLAAIVKAPMSFFDTTPTGRVLNRFSQDMNTVDAQIRFTIMAILRSFSGLITTIVAISYTSPIFLVLVPPLGVAYYFLQRFYVTTYNQLRRILNIKTSPIYSHFSESIMGASSIRAYRIQEEFTEDSDRRLDAMQEARYPAIVTNRWLSVWLEVLGAVIVLFCALYAVIARDTISAGLVGLSISYSLQITDRLAFFVRNMSDLENNVVAVERIDEYSKTPSEAPWYIHGSENRPGWPEDGKVSFKNYSTRYRPGLDLVLRQISCDIDGGQKVGIVGRTGAGKSSFTLGLFRLIEPAEGSVVIDNINSITVGLHELRSKLTIIPQDPVLFSGTLRFNLDPFEKHSDQDLWASLELAHLKVFVTGIPKQLNYECGEGGLNLSVGQRQLVCLARALLRRSKILVLDEATAAVDLETDDLIQHTIKEEFKDSTVITIAHRINTVIDYDRIMVLDRGKIRENDSPSNLLEDKKGIFYGMCKDAGII